MTTHLASLHYDLFEAAGPRLRFMMVVGGEGIYISDYCEYWLDLFDDGVPDFAAAYALWQDIRRSARQAESLMSLASSPEAADRIFHQHQEGLAVLYAELKTIMQRCGIRFAA